jgi:hypothetical protein
MQQEAGLILPDGVVRPLDRPASIGRAAENDVVIAKGGVSRRHAAVAPHGRRWFVEDKGSYHGTFVNGVRLAPGVVHPLRHADRIRVGPDTLIFIGHGVPDDPDDTAHFEVAEIAVERPLSPFQAQVVRELCASWLAGGSLDDLPTNEQIAARIGTPGAQESVKAALRRAYAKAGLSGEPASTKRRKLCAVARSQGWV